MMIENYGLISISFSDFYNIFGNPKNVNESSQNNPQFNFIDTCIDLNVKWKSLNFIVLWLFQ